MLVLTNIGIIIIKNAKSTLKIMKFYMEHPMTYIQACKNWQDPEKCLGWNFIAKYMTETYGQKFFTKLLLNPNFNTQIV
jgi:hypothetical protein